jgi:AcrR family transcriptional regulator
MPEAEAVVRRTGRPRSQEAWSGVIAATTALLREGGLPSVTIEAISARSGVGKPTIYRYWPNKLAVAIDAFADQMANEVPPADLGDARSDLTEQVRRVAAFCSVAGRHRDRSRSFSAAARGLPGRSLG